MEGAVHTRLTRESPGEPLTPVGALGTPLVYEITAEPFPLLDDVKM